MGQPSRGTQPSRVKNLAYATIAGQTGCLVLVFIIGALIGGLALDAQFQVRGPFTIGCLLLSIPVSLFFMVRIALESVRLIQQNQPVAKPAPRLQQQRTQEEDRP